MLTKDAFILLKKLNSNILTTIFNYYITIKNNCFMPSWCSRNIIINDENSYAAYIYLGKPWNFPPKMLYYNRLLSRVALPQTLYHYYHTVVKL